MKLQEGVHLHFLPAPTAKTNSIHLRFAAPFDVDKVAGRALLANLLEMANQDYPTAQLFRKQLASLYGARLTTQVFRKGQVHLIDMSVSYPRQDFLPQGESLLPAILKVLEAVLTRPLATKKAFEESVFSVEKEQLMAYLQSEEEDPFYRADSQLRKAFFQEPAMQVSSSGTLDLVAKETAVSVYTAFTDMLHLDRLDIFVLGEDNQELVTDWCRSLRFTYRNPKLKWFYKQEVAPIIAEVVEQKEVNQSVLEVAYHLPVLYKSVNYPAFLVFNGLFALHAHSKLFQTIREKEGLAYTIGSSFDTFSGLYSIYMGIEGKERLRAMRLVHRELRAMQQGRFSQTDMDRSKQLLLSAMRSAQDHPSHGMEKLYHQLVLTDEDLLQEELTDLVNQVSREDVQTVAQSLRLQAVYFMEGSQ